MVLSVAEIAMVLLQSKDNATRGRVRLLVEEISNARIKSMFCPKRNVAQLTRKAIAPDSMNNLCKRIVQKPVVVCKTLLY